MYLVMYVIFYQKINNKKYHYFYKSYYFSKIQHTLTYSKFIEQMCNFRFTIIYSSIVATLVEQVITFSTINGITINPNDLS